MTQGQSNLEEALAALAAIQERTQGQIGALAEAQRATEERLQRVEGQIEALVQAQRATEERLQRVEGAIDRLTAQVDRLVAQVEKLVAGFDWLRNRTGQLIGMALEQQYRNKAPAYFGTIVRKARVVSHQELDGLLDQAVNRGVLSDEEKHEVLLLDLVVHGREPPPGGDVHLAVEVSQEIWAGDVERAVRRAGYLERAVGRTLPIVAGEGIVAEAAQKAAQLSVWQLLDGRALAPS